jgi:hypothetical protein
MVDRDQIGAPALAFKFTYGRDMISFIAKHAYQIAGESTRRRPGDPATGKNRTQLMRPEIPIRQHADEIAGLRLPTAATVAEIAPLITGEAHATIDPHRGRGSPRRKVQFGLTLTGPMMTA